MITRRFFVTGLSSLAAAGLRIPKLGDPYPKPALACSALDPLARKMLNAGTPIRVFVNGREVKYCTAFDSREGWAEFCKFKRENRPINRMARFESEYFDKSKLEDDNPRTLYSRIYGEVTTEPPIAELVRLASQF